MEPIPCHCDRNGRVVYAKCELCRLERNLRLAGKLIERHPDADFGSWREQVLADLRELEARLAS